MQITLRVTRAGADATVTATTPDILDFEEHFSKSFLTLATDLSYTDLCWLAWRAQRRLGSAGDDFRAWAADVDVSLAPDVEAVPVPLDPSPGT